MFGLHISHLSIYFPSGLIQYSWKVPLYISSGRSLKYRNRNVFIFVVDDSVDLYEMLYYVAFHQGF